MNTGTVKTCACCQPLTEVDKLHYAIADALIEEWHWVNEPDDDDIDFAYWSAEIVVDVLKARGLLPIDAAASN